MPRRRLLRWGLPLLAAAVLAAVLILVTTSGSGNGGSSPPAAVRPPGVAADYHVVYRVTGPHLSPYAEALWVRRPFDTVDVTYTGTTTTSPVTLSMTTRLGAQVVRSGAATQSVTTALPARLPAADVRLDSVLPDATTTHLLRAGGTETIAGRRCQDFRSAGSLRSGTLAALPATPTTYVDSCLDGDGILLRERSYRGGTLVTDRTATAVTTGPAALAGAPFDASGTPLTLREGGGQFAALTLDSRPPTGDFLALPHAPAGFVHTGRYAVVPPQPQAFNTPDTGPPNDLGLPNSLVTAIDDVYVRGADAIIVEQGQSLGGSKFAAPTGATAVPLGATLGDGQLQLTGTGPVVNAEPAGARRFLRVSGTIQPAQLVALTKSLRLQKPGQLVRLTPSAAPSTPTPTATGK